jgi:hypothetical protein
VTSDAGLLAYRELDDVLGLTEMAGDVLADTRSGKNGRHALAGLFRQSVFGRLAGYEDVNDAERLRHDPAMRWIVGGKAAQRSAASPSQMRRDAGLGFIWRISAKNIPMVHIDDGRDIFNLFTQTAISLRKRRCLGVNAKGCLLNHGRSLTY